MYSKWLLILALIGAAFAAEEQEIFPEELDVKHHSAGAGQLFVPVQQGVSLDTSAIFSLVRKLVRFETRNLNRTVTFLQNRTRSLEQEVRVLRRQVAYLGHPANFTNNHSWNVTTTAAPWSYWNASTAAPWWNWNETSTSAPWWNTYTTYAPWWSTSNTTATPTYPSWWNWNVTTSRPSSWWNNYTTYAPWWSSNTTSTPSYPWWNWNETSTSPSSPWWNSNTTSYPWSSWTTSWWN